VTLKSRPADDSGLGSRESQRLKDLEAHYQQEINTQALQWKQQVEVEVSQRVQIETEARMTEAMQRMQLSEIDINRALNPPNQIGNTEMNEESKESTTVDNKKTFPKRNGRYTGE
jgi:hypothetical protein